ncbi:hypothetical protein BP6252_02801 [Coleophoma cylindrospora]|uniref:Uncharacterized protein n=1 Tax=Coleophoma cylindrospora TaxID=1849047 RepID=A0A3D8SG98_9HELO|nr:hypothetical protein BP6252_02801 [Coleophoma cylindrospora]
MSQRRQDQQTLIDSIKALVQRTDKLCICVSLLKVSDTSLKAADIVAETKDLVKSLQARAYHLQSTYPAGKADSTKDLWASKKQHAFEKLNASYRRLAVYYKKLNTQRDCQHLDIADPPAESEDDDVEGLKVTLPQPNQSKTVKAKRARSLSPSALPTFTNVFNPSKKPRSTKDACPQAAILAQPPKAFAHRGLYTGVGHCLDGELNEASSCGKNCDSNVEKEAAATEKQRLQTEKEARRKRALAAGPKTTLPFHKQNGSSISTASTRPPKPPSKPLFATQEEADQILEQLESRRSSASSTKNRRASMSSFISHQVAPATQARHFMTPGNRIHSTASAHVEASQVRERLESRSPARSQRRASTSASASGSTSASHPPQTSVAQDIETSNAPDQTLLPTNLDVETDRVMREHGLHWVKEHSIKGHWRRARQC